MLEEFCGEGILLNDKEFICIVFWFFVWFVYKIWLIGFFFWDCFGCCLWKKRFCIVGVCDIVLFYVGGLGSVFLMFLEGCELFGLG